MANPYGNQCSWFTRFANAAAKAMGHPLMFAAALSVVLVWAIVGPLFGFSDTWQLVINTGTTIVTFLMVFLIQNTQNRDTHALQVKLDELIYSNERANNAVMDVEELDEADLDELRRHYEELAARALDEMRSRRSERERSPDGRSAAREREGDS